MLLIQLTGLSGAGKSTIAKMTKDILIKKGMKTEILDGDEFRKTLCKDLSFTKNDRIENIMRLGVVGNLLARNGIITVLAAINPYEEARNELKNYGPHVKTVLIECDLDILISRDTKDLYKKALLPDGHPDKINNLTGVNDPFERPAQPDLIIDSGKSSAESCAEKLADFIMKETQLVT